MKENVLKHLSQYNYLNLGIDIVMTLNKLYNKFVVIENLFTSIYRV